VPVEDDRWRLRRRCGEPTLYALKNRPDGLEQGPEIDSVALTVKRYNISRGRRLALKVFEHIAGNSQLQHLFFFHTIGSDDNRGLIHKRLLALKDAAHQDIAIRFNVRSLKVGFREDVDSGGQRSVVVGADGRIRLTHHGQI